MFKQKFIIIIILATIFGFFSGLVGALIARTYLMSDAFDVPMFGNINFIDKNTGSNLVIRDAKKVVVEQNVKVDEVARSARQGMVGFYKNNNSMDEKNQVLNNDLNNYLNIEKYQGQGFVITSDGWIVTDYFPAEIEKILSTPKATNTASILKAALKLFIVIDNNSLVYVPTEVINVKDKGYVFWKIEAKDLPVKKFIPLSDIKNGQLALAVNLSGWTWLTSIVGLDSSSELLKSSDDFRPEMVLGEKSTNNFYSSFLLDLNGDLLGIIDSKGVSRPISNFLNCIDCLLAKRQIKRPGLGLHYIDLSKVIKTGDSSSQKGVLIIGNETNPAIASGSAAQLAGLKEGDVIVSINNLELNIQNDLAFVVSQFKPGEKINLKYVRKEEIKQLELILGSL